MSGWDFWNNPLVVTAMRLKYRKGSPGLVASAYAVALLGIGGLLHYFESQPRGLPLPFGRMYLVVILTLQFAVSGAMALFGVSSSMTAEVANRTLDFQRLVSLSPRQIMLGKMLGEPAAGYFFALTTIPFAVICWFLGAASATVIVMLYVNLASFTALAAACGLMHTLKPPENSAQKGKGSFAGLFIVVIFMVPTMLSNRGALLGYPWPAAAVGSLSPIGSLVKLAQGNAWEAVVTLWGWEIPSLVFAPVVQLAMAAWIMAAMSRRLRNALDPPLKRSRVYAATLAVDMIAAGVACTEVWGGSTLLTEAYHFCLVHLAASLAMTLAATPSHEALSSWIWRRNKQPHRWRQRIWGDRSPALAMYAVQAAIGVVVFLLAAWAPVTVVRGQVRAGDFAIVALPLLATAAIAVSLSTLFQAAIAVAPKSGRGLAVFLIAMLAVLPPIAGSVAKEFGLLGPAGVVGGRADVLLGISPAGYLLGNISRWNGPAIPAGAPLAVSVLIFAWAAVILHRWIVRQRGQIASKLSQMGVPEIPLNAEGTSA